MIDMKTLNAYINEVLASVQLMEEVRRAIEEAEKGAEGASGRGEGDNDFKGNYPKICEAIEKDKTNTLELTIIMAAKRRVHGNKSREQTCAASLSYSIQVLGIQRVLEIVEHYTDEAILDAIGGEEGFRLAYEYRTIKHYALAARLCGLAACLVVHHALATDAPETIDIRKIRESALSRGLLEQLKANGDVEATERGELFNQVFRSATYHDIGMCVLSGVLLRVGLMDTVLARWPNGLAVESSDLNLQRELELFNKVISHREVGEIFLREIEKDDSYFHEALNHYERQSPFSHLMDIAHNVAVAYYGNGELLAPSYDIFLHWLRRPAEVEAPHRQCLDKLTWAMADSLAREEKAK